MRVEVADSSPKIPLAIKRDELDDGRRGLILVNAVTDDRGVIKRWDGTGEAVWFECVDRRKSTGARARFSSRPPTGPRP
ncbi:hypothetical protein R2B67_26575 [Streptomyces cyaneofuscatus]|uniref:hypothetical protein n=1 Tax=Streptomyces cyaneofuscatus TaxID=66883 RepID=UPI00295348CC|nr:hypothetical protein [Streptomyces cyaneofuscatus]WOP11886.1 hypothetical protein R2B67_26575 [Streptomyces cyaneofuscatus]